MNDDPNFLEDENQLLELMNNVVKHTELIRYEISKAKERRNRTPYYNCAALFRCRKRLLELEKIGVEFRKLSVKYSKEASNEKKATPES